MEIDEGTKKYFDFLDKGIEKAYEIAEASRKKNKDPESKVDIPIAEDLAARVEGLVSMIFPDFMGSGLKEGIRELEAKYGKNDERVSLSSAEMVAKEKFCKFESKEKSVEAGLRVGLAYLTLGVVTAPLEGISAVRITDGYISIYYSGPIRSAGGTASAMSVLIADFLRKKMGIGKYEANETERKRYATEVEDYYRLVGMQYHPNEKEIDMIISKVNVCLTGDPTEKFEVSNYKDLPRVETNRIRGGMCLVVGEGLTLKAPKLLKRVMKFGKDFDLEDWMWLEKYNKLKMSVNSVKSEGKETEEKYTPSTKYISKVIAGRPILSHPARPGGFRLRYGSSRTTGTAATSLHPGVFHLTRFIAVGTQLATELPGKATVCTPVDTIEPPVVLLKDGTVRKIYTAEDAQETRSSVYKILSMGDILIPYGEFVSQNHILLPSSYCEEWWALETKKAREEKKASIDVSSFVEKPYTKPTFDVARKLSEELSVPMHPAYNYFWHDLSGDELCDLIVAVSAAREDDGVLLVDMSSKKALEKLCLSHCLDSSGKMVAVKGDEKKALKFTLGCDGKKSVGDRCKHVRESKNIVDAISFLSGVKFREKGPTRVGLKMGRPEKAERRLMKGRPQVLFPCGAEGGRMRNIMEAYASGKVSSSYPTFRCPKCNIPVFNRACYVCGTKAQEYRFCSKCKKPVSDEMHCGVPTDRFRSMIVNPKKVVDVAAKKMGIPVLPKLLKGVRGVSGANKDMEAVEKGLLREKYGLYVNKDGTTRYDAVDVPITHFKPKEIDVSVEILKKMGYEKDVYGKAIERDDQIIELKVQDIIISDNSDFSCVGYFINVCKFVDELLEKHYGQKAFYRVKKKDDLVGQLVIGLAPHTSAGIIGRIIGFTPAKICYAHPFWHAAKRRNCDGDEDSILLLMDALVNFSRKYLPTTRGAATMDAPLVLTTHLDPEEVDDEAWTVDVVDSYPLSFYEDTMEFKKPWEIRDKIKIVEDMMGKPEVYHSMFTHDTADINDAVYKSRYVVLETMSEKLDSQLKLATQAVAVDESDVSEKILEKHLLKDIKGNMRTFSRQKLRCVSCNAKYRRVPLTGKCACGGKLLLTVSEGTVRKYIEPAKHIMSNFKITSYLRQQFAVLESEVDAFFGKKARQFKLGMFGQKK
ncbi:MAG: DNA polymerase II large subunit [Candidatus Aenigmarchaeota archaeon]|nr:DNA polymerase II large subunit [Candidatus Aenigmarchaeota archaeon]